MTTRCLPWEVQVLLLFTLLRTFPTLPSVSAVLLQQSRMLCCEIGDHHMVRLSYMRRLIGVQFEILQNSSPKILGELGQCRHSQPCRLLHCIQFIALHFFIYINCGCTIAGNATCIHSLHCAGYGSCGGFYILSTVLNCF